MRRRHWSFGAGKALFACLLAAMAQAALLISPAAAIEPLTPAGPFWTISEVRAGVFNHALEDNVSERGIAMNLEALSGRLPGAYGNSVLNLFLTPRLHIGTSLAFGPTDEYYWGLTWDAKLFGPIFAEASFGGAVHNGALREPGESSYGCRVNFRESFSLGYAVTPRLRVLATIDHMSNGNLCEPNHGLTNAGLRLGYHF